MKILYDLRPLQDGSVYRGIGRYSLELIRHLRSWHRSLNLQYLFDGNLKDIRSNLKSEFDNGEIYSVPVKPWYIYKYSNKYEKNYVAKTINNIKTDIIHFPSQLGLNPFIQKRYIVTVHDIIPHVFNKKPFFYGGGFKYFYNRDLKLFTGILNNAEKIITVSNCSKKDIIKELGISEERIEVIHNGIGNEFKRKVPKNEIDAALNKYGIKSPYILYVGAMEERKNIKKTIEIFKAFRESYGHDYRLVIVGKKENEASLKRTNAKDRIIFTGYIPDNDLICLYSGAEFFIFLSLYEGFGMTPLEAMVQGLVVLSLKNSSIYEILGDAPIYIKTDDIKDVVPAMIGLCNNKQLKELHSRRGVENSKKYSWSKTAEETVKIYEKMLANKS